MSTQPDHYYTIDKPSFAEFKDRGSRFLAYAYPIASAEEFKSLLQQLKKEHPKAVHHCFAYRLGTGTDVFRSNDDGEPSGTAGKPILGQIDSKQLTDVAVIVVRYFGGTLLGVPGLINAYKTVTSMALQLVPVVQKAVLVEYRLQFDYTRQNEVMTILKQLNCVITRQAQELFCIVGVGVPQSRLEEFEYKLRDLHTVEYNKIA
jgi:uncharacterized YigZ family protein